MFFIAVAFLTSRKEALLIVFWAVLHPFSASSMWSFNSTDKSSMLVSRCSAACFIFYEYATLCLTSTVFDLFPC